MFTHELEQSQREFKAWLKNPTLDKKWRNHCLRYWLYELGGMAGRW